MPRTDANELASAFAESTFFYAYQPVVDLRTAEVPYVEALLRWDHPTLGILHPGSFLPLIHGAGLSTTLTEWGLNEILAALPPLRALYGPDVAVALNLSRRQLADPEATAAQVHTALHRANEKPESLIVEMVEDLTSGDMGRSASALAGLRSVGVRVVLDDFGTGAGSLSVLTEMDYDGLKIDLSFVRGMVANTAARSVVESILAFGANTGISVVAEGVESALEYNALTEIGCSLGQGYFLGRPRRLNEVARRERPPGAAVTPRTSDSPHDETRLASLFDEIRLVNPRSTTESFDVLRTRLETLDKKAVAIGRVADIARCEIGQRLTLISAYAGRHSLTQKWAMHTSHLAEQVEEWGFAAEALSTLAACSVGPTPFDPLRIESLARAMKIRITKPMGSGRSSMVDNCIGAALANLGLWDHAQRWWEDSNERHANAADPGAAMCGINLVELGLRHLEGEIARSDDTPRELILARLEQLLVELDLNTQTPNGVVSALACRLELVRHNLPGALSQLDAIEDAATDMIPAFLILWARALAAQAQGQADDFLRYATELVDVLSDYPLMRYHLKVAESLRGRALIEVGRVDEGAELLQRLLAQRGADDAGKLSTLFESIRLHIDLDVRSAELLSVFPVEAEARDI